MSKEVQSKEEYKVTALTQRIGDLVSKYEEQLAELRAQATIQVQTLQQQVRSLQEELNEKGEGEDVSKESKKS